MNPRIAQGVIFALLTLFWAAAAGAHPIPDIPVRTFFPGDGTMRVTVEVDPRCFDADPNIAPSVTNAKLATLAETQKEAWKRQAAEFTARNVEFHLDPVGRVLPEFAFTYTAPNGAPLPGSEDVVVLTGEWRITLAAGVTGWRIRAAKETKLSVVFVNTIRGEVHPRLAVLFPGENSYTLDISSLATGTAAPAAGSVPLEGSSGDRWSTFFSFLRQGFIHVVPEGLDHILFVLGIFLLSRQWRPLLAQVTTFTLAHSVTLALATLGLVHVPGSIVEPIIAASIAAVAIENIFHARYTHWRLLVIFAFGLIHGLGFAGALSDLDLPQSSLAVGLVGFNLGVEGGQLAVIGTAFLLTFTIRQPQAYRRWIVIPGSLLIAACGLFWTVQRIFWAE